MYMLDERHKDLQNPLSDENTYTLGRIGGHNIVIVGLPKGRIGTNDSAAVITRMASTFPNIKFGMMVGVGGGIPEKTRLGDVVICSALGTNAGVVQHDMGTRAGGQFETRGFLSGPPTAVLTALAKFQADPLTPGQMRSHLDDMATMPYVDESYLKSDSLKDVLFESDYSHVDVGGDCRNCDKKRVKARAPRRADFKIHYGLIASGNTKVKDAKLRDELCKRYKNNLYCIEMEAAGLMNNFPCVVIRGICDYADSHAGKEWQNYAAAVAAACTKTLLGVVPEREVRRLQSVQDTVASSSIRTPREYGMQYHATSSPPLVTGEPEEPEEPAASAPHMIEWPGANYRSNLLGTANSEPRGKQATEQRIPANHGQPEDIAGVRRTNSERVVTQPVFLTKEDRVHTFPNTDPEAFFNAVEKGDIPTIQRELKNGTSLEITDEFGRTPLWLAVGIGKRNVIQILLEKGANVEAKNFHGQNILEWALNKGKHDIVNMVIAIGDGE
ncbi:uncharacterized protein TrAtP1_006199 [Trichoderma atroviride]|uniref:uncharacterized protein n=1 Tax=Hypocrea atroviridis TaxID=63577 RepID=UPI00332B7DC5|nr:hypothetical protein TrAtP1_006199 [Trichoderma atroviride]